MDASFMDGTHAQFVWHEERYVVPAASHDLVQLPGQQQTNEHCTTPLYQRE